MTLFRRYLLPRFRRYREAPRSELPEGSDDFYIPSPEDFAPSPPKPLGPLSHMPDVAYARPVVFCFVLFWAVSLQGWNSPVGDGAAASGEAVFGQHQYWRLLSALFAHSDVGHLLANTPLFLVFGWYLHAFFGWLAFPFVTLLIGVASNLWTISAYPPEAQLLGASGMLYGMVALWLVFYMRFETTLSFGVRLLRVTGVSLLLLFPTTFHAATSYLAHATGFLLGGAAGLACLPWIKIRSAPRND